MGNVVLLYYVLGKLSVGGDLTVEDKRLISAHVDALELEADIAEAQLAEKDAHIQKLESVVLTGQAYVDAHREQRDKRLPKSHSFLVWSNFTDALAALQEEVNDEAI